MALQAQEERIAPSLNDLLRVTADAFHCCTQSVFTSLDNFDETLGGVCNEFCTEVVRIGSAPWVTKIAPDFAGSIASVQRCQQILDVLRLSKIDKPETTSEVAMDLKKKQDEACEANRKSSC